jgi:gluconolactonase
LVKKKSPVISICVLMAATLFFSSKTHAQAQVERFDSALDKIIAPNAVAEKLADTPGDGTREGPVWVNNGNFLIYSDIPAKTINKWNAADGTVAVYLRDTESDGVTLDRDGRIVWVTFGKVVRLEKDGSRTVLTSQYEGKPLNAPNDLVYKKDGTLYFTDPGEYLMSKDNTQILSHDIPTVYSLKDGTLRVLTTDVLRVNGLAFTPDEKHIYINSSFTMQIFKFDVKSDDTLTNRRLFVDMNTDKKHPFPSTGFPDGMKVDRRGNVYCIGPEGIWIISPQGKHLGTILNLNHPANFTFGDSDGKTLYVTSRPGLYRIRLKIAGIAP